MPLCIKILKVLPYISELMNIVSKRILSGFFWNLKSILFIMTSLQSERFYTWNSRGISVEFNYNPVRSIFLLLFQKIDHDEWLIEAKHSGLLPAKTSIWNSQHRQPSTCHKQDLKLRSTTDWQKLPWDWQSSPK